LLVILLTFGILGCGESDEKTYYYELYSINEKTFSSLQSQNFNNAVAALNYAKSQTGTNLIETKKKYTIDDIKKMMLNLEVVYSANEWNGYVNDWIEKIEKEGDRSIWYHQTSTDFRFIYINKY
jgi:hypothetical protein